MVAERRTITEEQAVLAVVGDDDSLLGRVGYRRVFTGSANASFCWQIGITLLPEARGCGHGSAAQRLLAMYLFDMSTAARVEAGTDVDNVAEQRALERAGFRREGVMRSAQWRDGSWHDLVLYAVTRGDLGNAVID